MHAHSLLRQIETVPCTTLSLYPGNPRQGNVHAIAESLQANQQYAPLIVQRSTGYVLAGNHTLKAATQLGWETIDCIYVDVDATQARAILLSANKTADSAGYDDAALLTLLQQIDDFTGTGWSPDELDNLLDAANQLPAVPFTPVTAIYSESPDLYTARVSQAADAIPRAAYGVREAIIILPQNDYEELQRLIAAVKQHHGSEATSGEAVLYGMRVAAHTAIICPGILDCPCPWHTRHTPL